MKKNIIKTSIFLLLFALLVTFHNMWLPFIGTALSVKNNIQKADCIVPLYGNAYCRYKKAVELYNEGYSKNIVVSLVPEWDEELQEYYQFPLRSFGLKDLSLREIVLKNFEYFGKDSEGIYLTPYNAMSTYDEAVATKDFMVQKGFRSVILVTDAYHTRRALMIFRLIFRGTGIKIYICNTENKLINPARWWQKEIDFRYVILEYQSIIYNLLYHFILRKEKTSFDT